MSWAKFTLIGCEHYFNSIDQSVFDNLRTPEGLNKDVLIDTILLRGGEFEVQNGSPDFIRVAIGAWSDKWMPTMERWVNALAIQYNPLENYDRIEDWTDNTKKSEAASDRTDNSFTRGLSESRSDNTNNSLTHGMTESASFSQADSKNLNSSQEDVTDRDKFSSPPKHTTKRSAFDSNGYEPLTEETDTGKWEEKITTGSNESGSSVSNSTNNTSGTDTTISKSDSSNALSETNKTVSKSDTSNAMDSDAVHSGRIHGNIGVTTSQQMLLQELQLGYWNIYEKVTELFLQEFTIPVYI